MAISSTDSKVWFDVQKDEPIFVDPYKSNHSRDAVEHPEKYRLSKDAFANRETTYDYDGHVLFEVMKQGFVRVMIDYRDPRYGCNVEGISLRDVHAAVLWLDTFVSGLRKVILVIRKSEGEKDADVHILNDPEKLEFFLKYGKILRDRF